MNEIRHKIDLWNFRSSKVIHTSLELKIIKTNKIAFLSRISIRILEKFWFRFFDQDFKQILGHISGFKTLGTEDVRGQDFWERNLCQIYKMLIGTASRPRLLRPDANLLIVKVSNSWFSASEVRPKNRGLESQGVWIHNSIVYIIE